jgi:Acyl-CoA carboxylase epsilon subunit
VTPEESASASGQPPLRLVRGDATPEEVAALLAVLTAASAGDPGPAPRRTTAWTSRERAVRRLPTPGPGAWRASAWPR